MYAYAAQIYCDFSGYTDIAIGIALLLGIRFPQNFDGPYTATSLRDFWRRWHMTLSRFLRDYLYIPLGGNRKGTGRTYVNLMLTMLLGGLWHGASWTFVVWGGIHGTGLAVEHAADARRKRRGLPAFNPRGARRWIARLITFQIVCIAWVFFRATSFSNAWSMFGSMIHNWGMASPLITATVLAATVVGIGVQYVPRRLSGAADRRFRQTPSGGHGPRHRGVPDRDLQPGARRRRALHLLLVLGRRAVFDVRHLRHPDSHLRAAARRVTAARASSGRPATRWWRCSWRSWPA